MPIDLNQIPEVMVVATVAGEDPNYLLHHGVDWRSTKRAFNNAIVKRKRAGGGSTITQQVVKNLFLSHKRSYVRKSQEIFLSLVIEKIWSKRKILETYLNITEFGEAIFGIETAAKYYFNKSAKNLNKDESVWLVTILPNPKFFQQNRKAPFISQRMKTIKYFMRLPHVRNVAKRMTLQKLELKLNQPLFNKS